MKTFVFVCRNRATDALRDDILLAPDRATAIRKAAMRALLDNDWLDDRLINFDSLTHFHNQTFEILREWTDNNGSACPNCRTGTTQQAAEIWNCQSCGYTWTARMAKDARRKLEARATKLIEELDEFEATWFA